MLAEQQDMGRAEEGIPSTEELLAEVAHDLRGYLTVIKGYAQLMEAEALCEPDAQRDASRRINRTCSLMTELLESCLDLEVRRSCALPAEAIDPVAVLIECVSFHAITARSKSIRLVSRFPELPHLALDGSCLRRIVANLLANAIKFTPCGRQVVMSARLSDEGLAISVEDEGPGLAQQEIPAIFARHRRGSARATAGEKGYGLGLAIVRRLVHACNGVVRVRTLAGRGTIFTVILPVTRIAA
jgi:signal transduction histidine kinase